MRFKKKTLSGYSTEYVHVSKFTNFGELSQFYDSMFIVTIVPLYLFNLVHCIVLLLNNVLLSFKLLFQVTVDYFGFS
jgi:hypothetical protein